MTNASQKAATLDHPVHELLATRWSPYAFADRRVSPDDLRSLFEAARWAPSSYNEQPWSYLVASRHDAPDEFARLLSCLNDGNQAWAGHASVLALGVVTLRFKRNDKPNSTSRTRTSMEFMGLIPAHQKIDSCCVSEIPQEFGP
jgi:nitroreductase